MIYITAYPASEKLKGLGPQSFRKGSVVISSINKPDHCIVSLLYVFVYIFVYDSAPTAHRRLIVIYVMSQRCAGAALSSYQAAFTSQDINL